MKKIRRLLIILAVALLLISCNKNGLEGKTEENVEDPIVEGEVAVIDLSIKEARELIKEEADKGLLILDVRSRAEYDAGHIENAILIPVEELEARLDEVEGFIDLPVLVYCRSGSRSRYAADLLLEDGFTKVYNLTMGFMQWK